MIEEKSDIETLDIPEPPPNSGYECQLRLRLSTGKDLKLVVRSTDTVYHMKRRLHAAEGVEPSSQRWFFSGRPLTDKMKLEELKIPKDYVVQVIISQPLQNPTPVENWTGPISSSPNPPAPFYCCHFLLYGVKSIFTALNSVWMDLVPRNYQWKIPSVMETNKNNKTKSHPWRLMLITISRLKGS